MQIFGEFKTETNNKNILLLHNRVTVKENNFERRYSNYTNTRVCVHACRRYKLN